MVVYPDDTLGMEHWNDARYVDSVEMARSIFRNELNEVITYRMADVVYVEQQLRPTAEWTTGIVRRYNIVRNVGEWIISNYNSSTIMPNSQCPICGAYSSIDEYTGSNILNITCERCVEGGYPEHIAPEQILYVDDEAIDWRPQDIFDFNRINNLGGMLHCLEPVDKVDWKVDGF